MEKQTIVFEDHNEMMDKIEELAKKLRLYGYDKESVETGLKALMLQWLMIKEGE